MVVLVTLSGSAAVSVGAAWELQAASGAWRERGAMTVSAKHHIPSIIFIFIIGLTSTYMYASPEEAH